MSSTTMSPNPSWGDLTPPSPPSEQGGNRYPNPSWGDLTGKGVSGQADRLFLPTPHGVIRLWEAILRIGAGQES